LVAPKLRVIQLNEMGFPSTAAVQCWSQGLRELAYDIKGMLALGGARTADAMP